MVSSSQNLEDKQYLSLNARLTNLRQIARVKKSNTVFSQGWGLVSFRADLGNQGILLAPLLHSFRLLKQLLPGMMMRLLPDLQ